jgi:hypothetical protein
LLPAQLKKADEVGASEDGTECDQKIPCRHRIDVNRLGDK